MAEYKTAHLVVVSPNAERPVGMLSTLDVARHVAGVCRRAGTGPKEHRSDRRGAMATGFPQ
jgi:CBS domain-containing protein